MPTHNRSGRLRAPHPRYGVIYQVASISCIDFFISGTQGGYLKGLQNKIDGMVTRINAIETGDSTSNSTASNVIYYCGYFLQ